MPIYSYKCQLCGNAFDEHRKIADRHDQPPCPDDKCPGVGELQMSAPMHTIAPPKGDKRIIWADRQVESSHGKDWRDKGTTRREGGIGRTTHFT